MAISEPGQASGAWCPPGSASVPDRAVSGPLGFWTPRPALSGRLAPTGEGVTGIRESARLASTVRLSPGRWAPVTSGGSKRTLA